MTDLRVAALTAALALHHDLGDTKTREGESFVEAADRAETSIMLTSAVLYAHLLGPAQISTHRSMISNQATHLPTGSTPTEGPVQIHDNEQFTLSLTELDAKGFPTVGTTPPTWSSSDETVVPMGVSPDGMSFDVVAGVPGSAVVTVSVTKDDGTVLTATDAVDVVPAGVAKISIVEGPVTVQP